MTAPLTRALAVALVTVAIASCAHAPGAPPATHAATVGLCHHAALACGGSAPTYESDVRPILAARCFKCHAGDGIAADEYDFSHIEGLRARRDTLANEVSSCAMPPSSEPPLPAAEASVLVAWASCGAR